MNGSCAALSDCCAALVAASAGRSMQTKTGGGGKASSSPRDAEDLGAVAYTIAMLVLFSSSILLLMIRAIRPRDDDQISSVLLSMRVRVDRDEKDRRQTQMRDAKSKAQRWLGAIAAKRLPSFRRANSDLVDSVRSLPLRPSKPLATRATSYQGFLPEIVVTGAPLHHSRCATVSAGKTRLSSGGSCVDVSTSLDE